TCDAALREQGANPADARTLKLNLQTAAKRNEFVRVRLERSDGDSTKLLTSHDLPLKLASGNVIDYQALAEAAEQLSRTKFVEALKQAGAEGSANPQKPATALSPAIETQLRQMNFLSQFAALRELHALGKTQGESSQTLAGLVRAYANLGVLSKFHWNASHKVFKARALIYAQRLMHQDGESAWALWHRAYALTLAGLHQGALADLEAARAKAQQASPAESPPAWEP